jgi:hypothetical protein
MSDISTRVIAACESNWEAHKSDCSGFVKAVAGDLGLVMTGMANDIVDNIQLAPWKVVGSGPAASGMAQTGFVVAGLKETGHGHVVVVVPGPLNRDKYPSAYWGRLGSVGMKDTTINWAWNALDRDRVIYSWHAL